MKSIICFGVVASLSLFPALSPAWADQTLPEKAAVVKNDAARGVKKTAHRASELVCTKSDAECLAKKAKHRTTEATDKVVDKAEEVKDKVDTK